MLTTTEISVGAMYLTSIHSPATMRCNIQLHSRQTIRAHANSGGAPGTVGRDIEEIKSAPVIADDEGQRVFLAGYKYLHPFCLRVFADVG